MVTTCIRPLLFLEIIDDDNEAFAMMHRVPVLVVLLLLANSRWQGQSQERVEIPTHFSGEQVYVELTTANGQQLQLYTDSGGGSLILSKSAADRLSLPLTPLRDVNAIAELGKDSFTTDAPVLQSSLPPLPKEAYVVLHARQMPDFPDQADGVVGAGYFANGIWTWDYLRHQLWKETSRWEPLKTDSVVSLGFKVDADGYRPTNFARIQMSVGGKTYQMLLDTGAETLLTPKAQDACADNLPAFRSASMIRKSVFEMWQMSHPDWKVIRSAQVGTGADMILVPDVEIAGLHTGPVWFTERSDKNYLVFMSSMMDQPVDGSLGGNAMRRFTMTVDYVHRKAAFRSPTQ